MAYADTKLKISKAEHENRNELNELPTGKLYPSPEDYTIWKDDKGRPWKLIAEPYASYHQPMRKEIAFIRAHLGTIIPMLKVPNLKFLSPNADGRYSEVCANRYTGELLTDQKIIGTFNFCRDAPDAMKDGKLPTTGEHKDLDMIPHEVYGGNYKYLAVDLKIGSKAPLILGKLDSKPNPNLLVLALILILVLYMLGVF